MRIRERRRGGGRRPVVYVHGAGVAGWMWEPALEAVDASLSVVVDLPDHGLAASEPFRSVEAAAAELAELVEGLGLEGEAVLVGHSLGARIVLAALAARPGLALGAVVSSALVRPSVLVSMMRGRLASAMSVAMLRVPSIARLQAAQFRFPRPGMVEAFLAEAGGLDAGRLERPIEAFASNLALPPGLGACGREVLVTVGSREPRAMRASAVDIASALPRARLATLEGADHLYPWTRAEEYGKLVAEFVAGLAG